MKWQYLFILLLAFIFSCEHKKNENDINQSNINENGDSSQETATFFPVTDFFKGEINKIKSSGKNPVKYFHNKQNKLDSVWIKMESFDSVFSDFITPSIDSINDSKFYVEKRFFDNTINAFTLTYDSKDILPPSKPWTHWDIYVNPESNTVSRIYLVKIINDSTTKQLTWIPDRSCKIISIKNVNNSSIIENEINIKW